jgi:hypothetical protein
LIVGGVYTQWTHFLLQPPLRVPMERTFQIPGIAVERVRRDPAIESATISGTRLGFALKRRTDSGHRVDLNDVDPSYFAFMGSKLLRGRIFEAGEQGVVVVDATAARTFGQSIVLNSVRYTVVGVVEDTGETVVLPHDPFAGEVFTPLNPGKLNLAVVLVRSRTGVRPDPRAVRLTDYFARLHGHSTMYATLFDFMGITVALVSALGLAGVLWCVVVQRARSMAIRVAIGARLRDIIRVLIAEFLLPMSVGVFAGVFLGANFWLFGGRYLQGVGRFDPATYLGTIGLFVGIGLVGASVAGARAWLTPALLLQLRR